jgi:Domain of unknown function (DUF4062)
MEKRYQVFVSSTYTDLKEERQRVTQTLMEMDCIPAGMELFPASDEEQWDFIKRIIDDCDYYLLIIGGRYGSITNEGISYTEKEYDYAVEIGLKVVALVHENPAKISVEKSDISPDLMEKLQNFRNKVSAGRLVKFWSESKELPGLVALSLSKTIKMFPAVGWVRASLSSNEELLGELNELRKENLVLKSEISKNNPHEIKTIKGLADLDEVFDVNGTYFTDRGKVIWTSKISWLEIFSFISPYLVQNPSQEFVKSILHNAILKRDQINTRTNTMNDQDFQTIAIQLKALGLVNTKLAQTVKGGMALFWSITPEGEKLMLQLRAIKSSKSTI